MNAGDDADVDVSIRLYVLNVDGVMMMMSASCVGAEVSASLSR